MTANANQIVPPTKEPPLGGAFFDGSLWDAKKQYSFLVHLHIFIDRNLFL